MIVIAAMTRVMIIVGIVLCTMVMLTMLRKKSGIKETYVGNLTVATDNDRKRAMKFALQRMCQTKGYKWVQFEDEFTYDCVYTKETCEKESIYPTKDGDLPQYYEWRANDSKDAKEAKEKMINSTTLSSDFDESSLPQAKKAIVNTIEDGMCIIGNETFRKTCEANDLTYNKNDGTCVTNKKYCNNRCLAYCNGDCYQFPTSWVLETVLGTTLGRSLGCTNNMIAEGVCSAIEEK